MSGIARSSMRSRSEHLPPYRDVLSTRDRQHRARRRAGVFAQGIQRRWRAWLTASVLTRWLANGRYYQLNVVEGDHKNPEYRIAEDLRVLRRIRRSTSSPARRKPI